MAKLYLICGKICAGKTVYARRLLEKVQGVGFSCDELMLSLFPEDLGEKHDSISRAAREYLLQKAMETVRAGCPAVLDWGFWRSEERKALSCRLKEEGIPFAWHYIDVQEGRWQRNMEERNAKVLQGETKDYYVDEGLLAKCLSFFDPPRREEMDEWLTIE